MCSFNRAGTLRNKITCSVQLQELKRCKGKQVRLGRGKPRSVAVYVQYVWDGRKDTRVEDTLSWLLSMTVRATAFP